MLGFALQVAARTAQLQRCSRPLAFVSASSASLGRRVSIGEDLHSAIKEASAAAQKERPSP